MSRWVSVWLLVLLLSSGSVAAVTLTCSPNSLPVNQQVTVTADGGVTATAVRLSFDALTYFPSDAGSPNSYYSTTRTESAPGVYKYYAWAYTGAWSTTPASCLVTFRGDQAGTVSVSASPSTIVPSASTIIGGSYSDNDGPATVELWLGTVTSGSFVTSKTCTASPCGFSFTTSPGGTGSITYTILGKDSFGNPTTGSTTVTVAGHTPVVSLLVSPSPPQTDQVVSFTTGASDSGNDLVSLNLSDSVHGRFATQSCSGGSCSFSPNPTTSYSTAGTLVTVTLLATDAAGNTQTTTKSFTVTDCPSCADPTLAVCGTLLSTACRSCAPGSGCFVSGTTTVDASKSCDLGIAPYGCKANCLPSSSRICVGFGSGTPSNAVSDTTTYTCGSASYCYVCYQGFTANGGSCSCPSGVTCGTGTGTQCCASGLVCDSGSSQCRSCTTGETRCSGNTFQTCSAGQWANTETCSAGTTCSTTTSTSSHCCTGQAACSGFTCGTNKDTCGTTINCGNGVAPGAACDSTQVCVADPTITTAGICTTKCTANQCVGNNYYTCTNGLLQLAETCSETCSATSTNSTSA